MLKRAFISLASKRHKKRKKPAKAKGYTDALSIAIIVNAKDQIPDGLDDFENEFRVEGKSVDLIYVGDKTTHLGPNCTVVRDQDFSVFGDVKTDEMKAFTSKNFDFVIVLDHTGNKNVELLASMCKSNFYVGYDDYPIDDLLTLQIKPRENQELRDIRKYLTMINHE
jgi:hypothetical protein